MPTITATAIESFITFPEIEQEERVSLSADFLFSNGAVWQWSRFGTAGNLELPETD